MLGRAYKGEVKVSTLTGRPKGGIIDQRILVGKGDEY